MLNAQQAAAAQRSQTGGTYILKLVLFSDHLSSFSTAKRSNDLEFWQSFVGKFFAPEGRLVQHIWNPQDGGRSKEYTITVPSLPRYYWTYYNSGVQNMQMKVENPKEAAMPNNCHFVAFEKAQFTFWYENGSQVGAETINIRETMLTCTS